MSFQDTCRCSGSLAVWGAGAEACQAAGAGMCRGEGVASAASATSGIISGIVSSIPYAGIRRGLGGDVSTNGFGPSVADSHGGDGLALSLSAAGCSSSLDAP